MKKLLVLGMCALFLTGCGGKKLTCTMTEDTLFDMEGKVVLTFDSKGEEIKKGSLTMTMDVGEEYADYMDEMKKSIESEYEEVKKFADVNIKTNKSTVKVEVKYNASKLNEDQKDELIGLGAYAETNYEETKADLEDMGYTCK